MLTFNLTAFLSLADSACTVLPISSQGFWFSGATELHAADMSGARGFIRTYNPFVANAPPIRGAVAAWVAGTRQGGLFGTRIAQVGWAKTPTAPSPFDAQVFLQFTDANGAFFPVQWFNTIFPPNAYFYQVNKPNPSVDGWDFWWGPNRLPSVTGLAWTANRHEAFAEEQNFSGDQTPGDTTAHTTFREIMWSDFANWQFSSFGTPQSPYLAGDPLDPAMGDRGAAGFDALTATDGSNFDTWDARCPTP